MLIRVKSRCDGTQPRCKTCDAHGDECQYEKMPAMSQVLAMATRLQEAEQTINHLKEALETQTHNQAHLDSGSKKDVVSVSTSPSQSLSPEEIRSDLSIDAKGQVSCSVFDTIACH